MAHGHPPSHGFGAAGAPAHSGHDSADDKYLGTPPGSGHEHTDASVGIIVKFGLWLAISSVVISAGMYLFFMLFVKQSEETTQEYPLAVGQEHRLPAGARLQQFPVNEHYEFRQQEDAVLQKYGWVDKETGVVRMPIAEAMRLTVDRGLPTRAQEPAAAADQPAAPALPESVPQQTPGLMPADSSAGRTLERRRQ